MERPKHTGSAQHHAQQHESIVPRYLSPHTHHVVSLQPFSPEKFALNLACEDRSAHVDYQWNGKIIAQLFTGNKKMLLKSTAPDVYKFLVTHPVKTGDFTVDVNGKITFQESVDTQGTALIACRSLKTLKDFCANALGFTGVKFVNEGSVAANNCTVEQCNLLHNKNTWIVSQDCHLTHVENLRTSKNSDWTVGKTWTGTFENVHLEGNASAGTAAIFGVTSDASFNGTFDTPILHTESNGSIECSPQSTFLVKDHVRLKAKDSIVCLGDIIEKSGAQASTLDDIGQSQAQFPAGIFIQSENGNVYKSGTIQVTGKPVYVSAHTQLKHNNLTETTGDVQAAVVLAGEQVILEKESAVKGCAAQISAEESLVVDGSIQLESPVASEKSSSESAANPSGLLTLNAKNITTTQASHINAETVSMSATGKIDQQGSVNARKDLIQTAPTIDIAPTASVTTAHAFIHGSKKLSQRGTVRANQSLLMRSNQLYNRGAIHADSAHFKADRWWVNIGTVNTRNESTIDALVSMNIFPGVIQAHTIRNNALLDLNLLGLYKSHTFDGNSLFRVNFGLHLPHVHSWRDLITVDNVKAAGERALLLWNPYSLKNYYQAWKMLSNVRTTYKGVTSVYNQWLQLPQTYSGASDIVPLLATSGNLAVSVTQQVKAGIQASAGILNPAPISDLAEPRNTPDNTFYTIPTIKKFRTIAEPFFPSLSYKAIVDVNSGLTVGCNGQFINALNINAGASAFANSYKLDTYNGTDAGIVVARDLSIHAAGTYISKPTSLIGAVKASIEADMLALENTILTGQCTLKATKQADIAATVESSHKTTVIAPEVTLQKECQLRGKAGAGTVSISADHIADEASISAERVHMHAKEVVLKQDSVLNPTGPQGVAIIQAENFTAENGSQFIAPYNADSQDRLVVSAEQADLQHGSSFDAGNGVIKIAAKSLDHATGIRGQQIILHADTTTLKRGSLIEADGAQALVGIQANTFTSEDGAVVRSHADTTDATGDRILLFAKHADLQYGSEFDAGSGAIKITTESLDHAAAVRGQQVLMHADNIVFKNSSLTKMHGPQALVNIQANAFTTEDGAAILSYANNTDQKDDRVVLVAQQIDLQEGSYFHAPNGAIKIDSENASNASSIDAQIIQIQARDALTLKDGSTLHASGETPLVTLQSQQLTTENGSQIATSTTSDSLNPTKNVATSIFLDAKNLDLQQGSHFSPAEKTMTAIVSEQATIATDMRGTTVVQANKLVFPEDATPDVNEMRAYVKEKIVQKGHLNASQLFMRAKHVHNFGKMTMQDGVIKADRRYLNMGAVESENTLAIDAPISINRKSFTTARHLTTNSLINIYLGSIDQTQTSNDHAFLHIDFGKHLPLDPQDLSFNWNKLWSRAAQVAAICAIPKLSLCFATVNVVTNLPSIASQCRTLYEDSKALMKSSDAGLSDLTGILNRTKALTFEIVKTATTGLEVADAVGKSLQEKFAPNQPEFGANTDLKQTLIEPINMAVGLKSRTPQTVLEENTLIAKQLPTYDKSPHTTRAGVLLLQGASAGCNFLNENIVKNPSYEKMQKAFQSACAMAGSCVNQSYNRTSLVDLNFGFTLGINGSSTNLFDCSTSKVFANYDLTTYHGVNLGFIAAANLSISAKKYQNGASFSIAGRKFETPACISSQSASIKADSFKQTSNARITSNTLSLETKEFDNAGTIASQSASIKADSFKQSSTANITSKNLSLETKEFDNAGTIASQSASIKADSFKQTSNANITSNTLSLETKEFDNAGTIASQSASIKADSFKQTSNANITSKNLSLETKEFDNAGTIASQSASIKADSFKQTSNANITSNNLSLETKGFDNAGTIASQSASIKADSFKQSSNARIVSNELSLEAKELDNRGTFDGNTNLKFTGNRDQLKNIGTITGDFAYSGPVAKHDGISIPSADELAEGRGAWGKVVNPNKILCNTNDPVYLNREHDINHSFAAKTTDEIKANPIKSQGFITLYAETNLSHKSIIAKGNVTRIAERGTITTESTVERVPNGTGYADQVHRVSVDSEKANTAYAGKDIIQTAVEVKSGKEGTLLVAKGNIVDKALECITHREHHSRLECTKDTYKNNPVSRYTSHGDLAIQASGQYIGAAPTFDIQGEEKIIRSGHSALISDVHNVHEHESTRKTDTRFSSTKTHEKTESSTSVGPQLNGHGTPFITDSPEIKLINPTSDHTIILQGDSAQVELGKNLMNSTKETDYANRIYESREIKKEESVTHVPHQLPGIENRTQKLIIQNIEEQADNFLKKVNSTGTGTIVQQFIKDSRYTDTRSAQRLTPGARVTLGILIGFVTQGAVAPISAGLTAMGASTAFSTAISHGTVSGLNCALNKTANTLFETKGDIQKTVVLMATRETAKDITLAAISSAATSGSGLALDAYNVPKVKDAVNFQQRLAYALPRQAINAGIGTVVSIVSGQSAKTAIKDGIKQGAADTLHTAMASQIGQWYASDKIHCITHKFLHGSAGAVYGGIIGGTQGAISGGLGAVTAEITGELLAPTKAGMNIAALGYVAKLEKQLGRTLTEKEFKSCFAEAFNDYMNQVRSVQRAAELNTAFVALLAGQNVSIAHHSADTAFKNNSLELFVGCGLAFATDLMNAALFARSAHEIYKSYQEGGWQAAGKQTAIEVFLWASGHYLGIAIAEAGYIASPLLRNTCNATLNKNPGLKILVTDLTDRFALTVEKIAEKPFVQGVNKIRLELLEQKSVFWNRFGFGKSAELAEKHIASNLIESSERATAQELQLLKPLGLGSTGRALPNNLNEQLFLEEIMSAPSKGKPMIKLKKGMTDARWHKDEGWVKYYYRYDDLNMEIHYVAQIEEDIIKAIDDFKFKDQVKK